MCPQLVPQEEWEEHGGWALGDRAEWSNRACGMAALRMILLAYKGTAPTVTELLKLGEKSGARVKAGWVHAALAELATELGVAAEARPVPVDELAQRLIYAPLIISVSEQFPEDGRRGGHLVVAYGYEDALAPVVLFRDPSRWGQTHGHLPLGRVAASYSGRAIIFEPLTTRGQA
ncbi:C39 family peptidase (plasmid) [Streptomyces sp. NBC_00015]|uniref:C39 family peptidase n=1 Tax=Streptomyces sp. NBC_00015 TaxID=2903611 RepID=UPI0032472047